MSVRPSSTTLRNIRSSTFRFNASGYTPARTVWGDTLTDEQYHQLDAVGGTSDDEAAIK